MPWFKKSKEQCSGFIDDMSPDQHQKLEEFKTQLQNENLFNEKRFDDIYLLRFLRHQKFNVEKAMKHFQSFLQWRKEYNVDNAFTEYDCSSEQDLRQIYKHGYHGTDKEGRPVYYEQPCLFNAKNLLKSYSLEELRKQRILSYERLVHQKLPACTKAMNKSVQQVIVVIDLQGFCLAKLGKDNREILNEAIQIGDHYYPEIFHRMFIINAPFLFRSAWSMIKSTIAANSRDKISILGSNYQEKLKEYIDPEQIPETFGGECTCEQFGGDCLTSDDGPWLNHKGDSIYRKAKRKLKRRNKSSKKKHNKKKKGKSKRGRSKEPHPKSMEMPS